MRHTARPSRPLLGQMPLLVPESSWVNPTELPDLRQHRDIGLDLETRDDGLKAERGPGWPYKSGYVIGMALAWEGGADYFPIQHPDTEHLFTREQIAQWLRDHERAGVRFSMQNAPYDVGWMWADLGVEPLSYIDDAIAATFMLDENRLSYRLDDLAQLCGLPGKDERLLREAAEAYVLEDYKADMWRLPARYVGPYAAQDAVAARGIVNHMRPKLGSEKLLDAYQLEIDLIPLIFEMRRRGVRVNNQAVEQRATYLCGLRDEVLGELGRHLGRSVTIDHCRSVDHMEQWFQAEQLNYPITPKTRRGSFQASWMRKHPHWLPKLVARAEQLTEAVDKFLYGFLRDYSHRGRLHANVNQYRNEQGGTRSYRLSYSDPPLQQMPARDEELSTLIRGVFEPEEGDVWLAADYSQQEYRLIVHYANLMGLRGADVAAQRYRDNPKTDFHVYVSEITGLERKPAKDTNFAKAFGAGVPKFAEMIGKSLEEAEAIYNQYDRELPFVSSLASETQKLASRRGYVRLLDGARSHFDMWEPAWLEGGEWANARPLEAAKKMWPDRRLRRAYTHKAMNRLIQGSAARQTKLAMRACWRERLVPLIQMHDELDFSVGEERQGRRVQELMRDTVQLSVPVMVDGEYGVNWGHAKKTKTGYGASFEEALAVLHMGSAHQVSLGSG